MTDEKEMIKERAKVFLNKQIEVHIDTSSGRFYNGLIQEVNADFLMLFDREFQNLMPLFFVEIRTLEAFRNE